MYLKLKTWVSPKKRSDLSIDEIVAQLKSQTSAATVEIAERYRFFKRLQRDDESTSVVEYMSQLRSLAKTCKFESYLDTALRDQFVCGLKVQRIQQELLCISDLTLTKALDKSRSMEVVHKETQSIRELGNPTAESKLDDAAAHRVFASKNKDSCYRCGGTGRSASIHVFIRIKPAAPVENWVTYPEYVEASCQQDVTRGMHVMQLVKHI